jgi:hypothetical protein
MRNRGASVSAVIAGLDVQPGHITDGCSGT